MSNRIYDTNGFFKSEGNPIARSGILEYAGSSISKDLDPNKIYKVWRPESELNNPETIESFRLIPWIIIHEMVGDGFTPVEHVGAQGVTGENIYFDEKDKTLKCTIKAFGSTLQRLIDYDGMKDLSIGMRCDYVVGGGVTPDGEPYDAIQTNIRGNHLASVEEGRAGKGVAVMDGAEVISFAMDALDFKPTDNKQEVSNMTIEEILAALKEIKPSLDQMKEIQSALAGLGGGGDVQAEAPEADKDVDVAEDADEDEKDDAKEKEKAPVAMDASVLSGLLKTVKSLQAEVKSLKGSAMDEASVIKAINAKNSLAYKVSKHVGAFDHNVMTSELEVAKYGVKKIGIACDSGSELAALNGWLSAKEEPTIVRAVAKDGAEKKLLTLEEME